MSSEVPDGWEVKAVGEIATITMGQSPPSSVVNDEGDGLPFIQGNAEFGARYPKPRQFAADCPKVVEAGDILLSVRAPVGEVNLAPERLCIGRGLAGLRPKDGDYDFLYYALGGLARIFARLSQGSTFDAINGKDLRSIPISLPPLHEQRQIAEVLRSVDEALHAARQVTGQCEQVLRLELDSIVAKLLADGVAKVKLGEVAKVKGGKRLPKGSEYSDEPTANPYIRVTDWRDYEIRTDHIRFISDDVAHSIWRYTISKADLFISIAGSVGLVATVPSDLDGAYLTENAAKICICDPNALNATFLLAVLRSRALTEQISRHKGVGGGVPKLALFRIEDLDIPLPDAALQAEIALSYESVRASVEAARKAANQLERTRTEVMSDLLSGTVRMPV